MKALGTIGVSGNLRLKVIRANGPGLRWHLMNRLRWSFIFGWLFSSFAKTISKFTRIMTVTSRLSLRAFRFEDESFRQEWIRVTRLLNEALANENAESVAHYMREQKRLEAMRVATEYGIVGYRVVTDAGVAFLVDAWQGILEPEIMRYHALGIDDTPGEAVGDVALQLEITTQYTPDNTRATGTLAEAAANIFRSVATNTMSDATAAVVEHGLMSQAATGGGTLWDRTVFAVVNLAIGDSLQSTYEATFNSGG